MGKVEEAELEKFWKSTEKHEKVWTGARVGESRGGTKKHAKV